MKMSLTWQCTDMMPRAHDDDVVIDPVVLNNGDALKSFVLENMDPLSQSCEMGIDLYMKALELVLHRLEELDAQ